MKNVIVSGLFVIATVITSSALAREVLDTPDAKRGAAEVVQQLSAQILTLSTNNLQLTSIVDEVNEILLSNRTVKDIELTYPKDLFSQRTLSLLRSKGAGVIVSHYKITIIFKQEKISEILAQIASEQDSVSAEIARLSAIRSSLRQ